MNMFLDHHRDIIRFAYSCFDRIILSGHIQALQMGGQVASFLWYQRQIGELSRQVFSRISHDYHQWVTTLASQANIEILEPEDERREDLVRPYFQQLAKPGIAVILKCKEPERIAVTRTANGGYVDLKRRWVNLYYFYVKDPNCGRMSIRVCPYFPFNISVWLNGHEWLACRMKQEDLHLRQDDNSFLDCNQPERLQALADEFGPQHIKAAIANWLPQLLPFFSAEERERGYRHELFVRQVEYCQNLIFDKKITATKLFNRLMDHGRSLGRPDKLAIVFGRPNFKLNLHTGEISMRINHMRSPVMRAGFKQTSIKQYVRPGGLLRTESTCYQLNDLSLRKGIDNLPRVREVLQQCNERYQNVQQDVLETYVDRGQMQELQQPTVSATGRRTPGMRAHDPRLLALLQALLCFIHLAGRGCFRTATLLTDVRKILDRPDFKLSQLRYDLGKLRGKGLVQRIKGTQDYEMTATGYRLAILYLKLHERFYAPLTAGIVAPMPADNKVLNSRTDKLDRLYINVDKALQKLADYAAIAA